MPDKKVLHIINGEYYAGAERVQDLLSEGLAAHNWHVDFAALKLGAFSSRRKYSRAQIRVFAGGLPLGAQRTSRIAGWARAEGISVVHTHTPIAGFIGADIAHSLKVPLVHQVHSPTLHDTESYFRNKIKAALEQRAFKHASRIIAVSEGIACYLAENKASARKVQVIENGIKPLFRSTRDPNPDGHFVFGAAAFFRRRKGLETLLAAFAEVLRTHSDVSLRVIGEFESSAYRQEIVGVANALGVNCAIEWRGFTDCISSELSQVDAFVLPSLFGEGLPMILLEAMSLGLPIIASRIPGIDGTIEDMKTGILVPPGDGGALAHAMLVLKSEPLLMTELGTRASAEFQRKYSWERMVDAVANTYETVL